MASTASVTDTAAPKPKASNKVRKRAPKACLSCRSRKVRCDVSQRGRPCMNCYLDSETCVVTGRASRFRRTQRDNNGNVQASFPPYAQDNSHHTHTAEEIVKSRANGQAVPGTSDLDQTTENRDQGPEPLTAPASDAATPMMVQNQPRHNSQPLNEQLRPQQNTQPSPYSPSPMPAWSSQQALQLNSDIVYSYYPFLSISNLPNVLSQDVNYLESQGCFRVPTKAILDEFIQQYFLHVHPLLPIFHEGDFWDIYCQQANSTITGQRISLLVFQAMIFSTCNFVSRNSIKALGFSSIRAARAAFYRRAKLLFDFESESSPIGIAQAALFLSFWTPISRSGARKPNSTWLSIAIHHAKVAEAHRYASFATPGPNGVTVTQLKRQNTLKRLWWCCIIRDRILPLGVRRSIQITRAHFDFDANSTLCAADLADEVDRSKVYNPDTKRALIDILGQLIDLCVLLTDMLVLVYPLDDTPGWGKMMRPDEMERVRDGKVALRRWYKGATLKFPMFGGGSSARTSNNMASEAGTRRGGREYHHDSVILYTNLMYMYYHCSRVALCHHEVLHLTVASGQPINGHTRDVSSIYENRHELQDAASGVTECLKELVQLRLARWLPISAVACTALPLVLHILDVKLSSPRRGSHDNANGDSYNQSALKQHRLNILIEAMKTYQPQYDGVDWVSETIRHVVNLAQLDSTTSETDSAGNSNGNTEGNGNGVACDWTDILTSHPSLYLRLALTMDLSLSKDRLPEEGDFPTSLRGLFTGGFNPVGAIFGAKERAAQVQQQQQQQFRRNPGSLSSAPMALGNGQRATQASGSKGSGAARMMEFLSQDQMLYYGKEMGIDMELDDAAVAGVGKAGSLDDSDGSDSDGSNGDEDGDHSSQSGTGASDGGDPASPGGLPRSASEHHHHHGLPTGMAGDPPPFQPFTAEEMDGLEAHVLDAFTLHNESPASSEGQLKVAAEMLFGEVLGPDAAGGWMEQVWGAEAAQGGGGVEDGDTARALLDAMKDE